MSIFFSPKVKRHAQYLPCLPHTWLLCFVVIWVGCLCSGGNLLVMAWVVSGQKCGSSTQVNSVAYYSWLPHPQGGKYPLWPFCLTQNDTFLVFSFHPGRSFFCVRPTTSKTRKKDKAALPRTVVFKGIDLAQRRPGDYFPNSGQR
jgi:hypothetical protein